MSTLIIALLTLALIAAMSFGIFMLRVNVKKVQDNEAWILNGHNRLWLDEFTHSWRWYGTGSPMNTSRNPKLDHPQMATLTIHTEEETFVQIYCTIWVPFFGEVLDPIGVVKTCDRRATVSAWLGKGPVDFYFDAREGKVRNVYLTPEATPNLAIPPHWWQRYLGLWA